jgi:hypothetical protein
MTNCSPGCARVSRIPRSIPAGQLFRFGGANHQSDNLSPRRSLARESAPCESTVPRFTSTAIIATFLFGFGVIGSAAWPRRLPLRTAPPRLRLYPARPRARTRRSATFGTFGVAALGSSLAVKPALSLSEGPALSLSKGHKVEEVEGPLFRPPFHFGDALGWLVPSKPTERARRRRCARCLMSKQPQSQLSPALNL